LSDVLDYTEAELRNMNVDELRKLEYEAASLESKFNTSQMTSKLLINSLYGALANKWFPLFEESMAQAITSNGRYFIRKLSNYIEETLQNMIKSEKPYIIYNDTDAAYFHIEPFMKLYQDKNPDLSMNEYVTWADSFEKKVISPIIQKCIDDFSIELNCFNKEMVGVEREIISDVAVFTKKKKYYARVRDSEGTRYPEDSPYIKVMGLDIIKSSTPIWSKKYLKEAIPHILDKDENDLRDWLRETKTKFMSAPLIDIAVVGGTSRIDYDLNGSVTVPIGARAAIVHNKYVTDNNIDDAYNLIVGGDKCKRLYLTSGNKFNSNIIAFTNDRFVSEIDCVDYDVMFEKGFLKPLQLMTDCLKYDLEKETEALDDW